MLTLEKDLLRFWSKVNKTDTCWLWTAGSSNKGYGRFKFEGKLHSTHVIAYQLHNDNYDSNKFVCHKCDNPACVNPAHLFLGTRSENMKDCVAKGRFKTPNVIGINSYHSKLTEENVKDIKRRLVAGERICSIVLTYNFVSRTNIEMIRDNKSWKHIIIE